MLAQYIEHLEVDEYTEISNQYPKGKLSARENLQAMARKKWLLSFAQVSSVQVEIFKI